MFTFKGKTGTGGGVYTKKYIPLQASLDWTLNQGYKYIVQFNFIYFRHHEGIWCFFPFFSKLFPPIVPSRSHLFAGLDNLLLTCNIFESIYIPLLWPEIVVSAGEEHGQPDAEGKEGLLHVLLLLQPGLVCSQLILSIFCRCTVCPRSSGPFYIVCYYIKLFTTSWAYCMV